MSHREAIRSLAQVTGTSSFRRLATIATMTSRLSKLATIATTVQKVLYKANNIP